jgi:hypothetical protein
LSEYINSYEISKSPKTHNESVVAFTKDRSVFVVNKQDGKLITKLNLNIEKISDISISNDSTSLVAIGEYGEIENWNILTKRRTWATQVKTIKRNTTKDFDLHYLRKVRHSVNNKFIAVLDDFDRSIKLFNYNGKQTGIINHEYEPIRTFNITRSGEYIITIGSFDNITIWSTLNKSKNSVRILNAEFLDDATTKEYEISSDFSSKYFAVNIKSLANSGLTQIYDTNFNHILSIYTNIGKPFFSKNGKYLVVCGENINIYDILSGSLVLELENAGRLVSDSDNNMNDSGVFENYGDLITLDFKL